MTSIAGKRIAIGCQVLKHGRGWLAGTSRASAQSNWCCFHVCIAFGSDSRVWSGLPNRVCGMQVHLEHIRGATGDAFARVQLLEAHFPAGTPGEPPIPVSKSLSKKP